MRPVTPRAFKFSTPAFANLLALIRFPAFPLNLPLHHPASSPSLRLPAMSKELRTLTREEVALVRSLNSLGSHDVPYPVSCFHPPA